MAEADAIMKQVENNKYVVYLNKTRPVGLWADDPLVENHECTITFFVQNTDMCYAFDSNSLLRLGLKGFFATKLHLRRDDFVLHRDKRCDIDAWYDEICRHYEFRELESFFR